MRVISRNSLKSTVAIVAQFGTTLSKLPKHNETDESGIWTYITH